MFELRLLKAKKQLSQLLEMTYAADSLFLQLLWSFPNFLRFSGETPKTSSPVLKGKTPQGSLILKRPRKKFFYDTNLFLRFLYDIFISLSFL